jgi:hypothetical protein
MKKIIKLTESDLNRIIKRVISESKEKGYYIRRFGKLEDLVRGQMEIQDPCNFDDGEEYADFCISESMCFFFGYNPWGNCEEEDDERMDEFTPKRPVVTLEEYNDIESKIRDLFYDELVSLWEELMEDGEC